MVDVSTDTADLAELAPQMAVYVPIHISGDGVTRALTRSVTAANNSKSKARAASAAARRHREQQQQQQQQQQGQQTDDIAAASSAGGGAAASSSEAATNRNSPTRNHASSTPPVATGNPKNAHLSLIPENFPIPATCSLTDLRHQLEALTRSKVFLGFLDPVTSGLVELRAATLEQFSAIPDQKKAIHCRLLKTVKSKSEQILAASMARNKRTQQQQQQQQQHQHHDESTASSNRVNNVSVSALPRAHHGGGAGGAGDDSQANNQDEQQNPPQQNNPQSRHVKRNAELINRLFSNDIARRSENRRRLEEQMYPQESLLNDSGNSHHNQHDTSNVSRISAATPPPAPTSSSAASGSAGRATPGGAAASSSASAARSSTVRDKRQIQEALDRLTDSDRNARHREVVRDRIRQQMVDEGYIVEPSQFRTVTDETPDELGKRQYNKGQELLSKREARAERVRQEERKRNVPRLKTKADWDEWAKRRARPMDRDRVAAANQPVVRVIGSLAKAPPDEEGAAAAAAAAKP